jgi:hypothetical protein
MSRNLPNWIKGYLFYTQHQESPEEFHTWVALSNIAGALRRQVFFDMGYFLVYPNLYIVLVSPAGKCKKSTAMRLGREVLTQGVVGVHFSPDSTSRERLIQDMSQIFNDGQSAMTAHSSEFASMLTTSGLDMVAFLTDIYDSPSEWQHRTKSSGTNKIKSPYLNLLAGTTPDYLTRTMPLDTIGIGLTSRVIFVYSDKPRRRPPRPKLSEDQKAVLELLQADLNQISQLHGEFTFADPDTEKFYDEWYMSRVERPNPTGDSRLAGFYERKPVHLLKVAMCISAAMDDSMKITMQHLEMAFELFDRIEPNMLQVFAGVGRNPLAQDVNQLWADILAEPEGFTKPEVIQRLMMHCNSEQIDEVLDTLITLGRVKLDTKTGRYYAIANS